MAEGGGGGQGQELSHSDLAKLEDELDRMMGSITTRVTKLDTMIDNLEGHWRGIGKGAFNGVQSGVKMDMAELNKILSVFTDGVKGTSKLSSSNEQEVLAEMKRVSKVDDL